MPISIRRVIADGASLVCSVESTRWPVSAASIAICAVSRSRISPTMITSGSARTIARSPVANVRPDLGRDLDLGEAVHLVLDRVLDRDDVLLRRVQQLQRGVQRGRLARAGRAGHEHGAVRLAAGAFEAFALGVGHAELVELDDDRGLVEDAHHDPLAVHARQRHDAQVDVAAVDDEPDAAVLGQAPLGDVRARP